jgi:parallel beta-helix repeat protein
MRKGMALLFVLVLGASGITTFLPINAEARAIVVPDDYGTISAAVEHAAEGSTIHVRRGRYEIFKNETLVINKTLSIIGEDAATTLLSGPGFAYGAVQANNEGNNRAGYKLLSAEASPSNFMLPPKVAFQVNADNFKISQVTIDNCDIGVSVSGNGTEVSHTKMTSASVSGSHSIISGNTMTGALTMRGSYQTITRNFGYIDTDGDFNIIAGNTAHSDINIKGSANMISGNSFSTMYLEYADSNTISNNSLSCIYVGFYGHACSNNTFSNNRVTGPGIWGILMGAGAYNVFHDNLVSNYTVSYDGYGIAMGGNHLVAEHNTFYRNILINNNKHVSANWEILGAGNYWDNGEEGNYWDDYTGTDINGDGIGDVPYTVEGSAWDDDAGGHVSFVFGQDNYPLMAPFDIAGISTELPDWAPPSSDPSTEPQPETTEPFPAAFVAALSAVTVAFVCAGLMGYFKKRKL